MKLERSGVASFRVTLHAQELAALTSAARLVAERDDPDVPDEARARLLRVLRSLDEALARPAAGG